MIPGSRLGSAVVTTPGARSIRITRSFDAPAALVYRVWTTPDLVRRWWGWETSPMIVCEIDLRVGGRWRYVTREPHGELGWHGTYRDIDPGRRLVSNEVFEPDPHRATPELDPPDAGTLNTITFVESDGVTTLTIDVLHPTPEGRDQQLASGMERGLQHGLDRVEALLADTDATDDATGDTTHDTDTPNPEGP